ncbi:MAG: chemotaxis protein CheW [Demequina sp.]
MDEIVREFVVESHENLDRLDRDLVDLESDGESRALLGSVFRTIHTIKGTSGFLGFGALESLTHVGESLLAELRDGKRPMTQRTTDVLLRMVDQVRGILAVIDDTGAEGEHDTSGVVAAIQQVLDSAPGEDDAASAERRAEPGPAPTKPRQQAPAKPTKASADLDEHPESEELPARSTAESSIRVDVEVLDALMRHVGELVLARNAMTRLATEIDDPALVRASQRLSLVATELQQGVMKTRMQPIDHVWSKVPRMVRDISATLGRRVTLEMIGKETELDRSVLEAIKDPLTHLIRNAIDHGVETPAARERAGKPAQGLVTLRAYHQGGQVVVEVADDGKGIDPQVVADKAVERGLRTPEQIAALGGQDILQMLFLPGFSTAETITNVSGRGVGMDVVKNKIDSIGGVVDVQSAPGMGTTWRLRIPLTLAIMPALTVDCAGETYAIPQVNLLELLAIDDSLTGVDRVGDAPVYRLRGQLLPLVDLRDVLGLAARDTLVGAVIAVMQADGGRFGLIIDQVRNTEEIVAKPIGAAIKAIGIYAGATLLGDGSVTLILDIPAVARRALDQQDALPDLQPEAVVDTGTEQMLVVAVGEDRQLAMPLGAVTRLERYPLDVLERVGGSLVMQYRGRITPVVDLASLLGAARHTGAELAVVVCARGDHAVALVAKEVVDIVDCAIVDRSDVSGAALVGSIVVKGKVTELLDLPAAVTSADPAFYDAHEPQLAGAGAER